MENFRFKKLLGSVRKTIQSEKVHVLDKGLEKSAFSVIVLNFATISRYHMRKAVGFADFQTREWIFLNLNVSELRNYNE